MRLTAGANTSLPPGAVVVELGWDVRPGIDADVSALLCTGRRVRSDADFVFFNQPTEPTGAVRHLGKETAEGRTRDALAMELTRLPTDVDQVVVAASLDAAPETGFAVLSAAELALSVTVDDTLVAVVPMAGFSTETAVVAIEVYRRGAGWKVRAVAQGYADGLAGLARDFGVHVDADEAPGPDQPASTTWDWRDPPVPAGYAV